MIDRCTRHTVYALVLAAVCLLALLLAAHAAGVAQAAPGQPTPAPQIGPLASTVGINGAPCAYPTIGEALASAANGDTLYLAGGQTYFERLGSVDKNVTLVAGLSNCSGPDPAASAMVTIDGGGGGSTQGGLLAVAPSRTLTLRHIRLQNAGATEGGIAYIGSGAALVLDGCQITDGQASSAGGGVFVGDGGTLTLINGSAIYGNSAGDEGGGILVAGGCTVAVSGSSVISGNTALKGGGMYVRGAASSIHLSGSRVDQNTADVAGGIRVYGNSILTLTGSTLNQNTAGDGGGLAVYQGQVTVDGGQIAGNDAGLTAGGGILQNGGAITLTGTLIDGNTARDRGGGIYCSAGTLRLQAGPENGGSLSQNGAGLGGGLYVQGGAVVEIRGLPGAPWTIAGNHAITTAGGAGAVFASAQLVLAGNVQIKENQAPGSGGGFYVEGGALWAHPASGIAPVLGPDNISTGGSGGAVYLAGGTLRLEGVALGVSGGGNSAAWSGGGICAAGGTVLLDDVQAVGNGSGESGGALAAFGSQVTIRASGTGCDPRRLPAGAYCSAFRENQGSGGAAIYLEYSTADISDTAFLSNQNDPSSPGSALLLSGGTAGVTNTLFSDNNITVVHVEAGTTYWSHSSTYAGNSGWPLYVFSGAQVTLTNNIIWSNTAAPYYQSGAAVSGTCNDTPALLGGAGNISVDPQFVTTRRGAYHLPADSPAVDICSSGPRIDLDGAARPYDAGGTPSAAGYDMGAFEYHLERAYLPLTVRE